MLGHALFAADEGVAGERDDEAWGAEPVEEAFAGVASDLLETSSPGLVRTLKDRHTLPDGRFVLVAAAVHGSLSGHVSGTVTGPVSGPVSGTVTGPVSRPVSGAVSGAVLGRAWCRRHHFYRKW